MPTAETDTTAETEVETTEAVTEAPEATEAPSTEQTVDREALEARVTERLAALGETENVQDEPDSGAVAATAEPESEEDHTEEDTQQPAPETKAAAETAPTLSDSVKRSLKAYGWSDEEITDSLTALGEGFVKTAEKLHANRNAEVSEWAAAGRQAREAQKPEPSQTSAPPIQVDQNGLLKPLDTDALKQKFGDDELVGEIAGPINAVIQQINTILPQVQAAQEAVKQANTQAISKQVDQFFGTSELKPYQELYGTNSDQLSESQVEARCRLLERAYDLRNGAKLLRKTEIPLHEALSLAHEIESREFRQVAERNKIKAEVKKRASGVSLKPTTAATRTSSSAPKTRSELEAVTRERMRELGLLP